MFSYTSAQDSYEENFTDDVLRMDFILAGDYNSEEAILYQVKRESSWAGPRENYNVPFDYGNYRIVVNSQDNKTIYYRGFSTLFEEYQTTEMAKSRGKAFYHTIRTPFPKDTVDVLLQKRKYETGKFRTLNEYTIAPDDYFIKNETPPQTDFEKIKIAGKPEKNIDIAFLAEGYTKEEMEKYVKDVKRVTEYIFNQPPFGEYADHFNLYAVKSVSAESGTDVPGENIYKNTVLNTSYYTFDVPRYLTTYDTRSIRNQASVVPYDHLFILINTKRYGGGGFYNHYTASTVDHAYSMEVAIHEFGHGFAGLGDEYYSSNVAYSSFYNPDVEPWEPNITTLVNFESKWKDMIKEEVPIPTPREKQYNNTIGVYEGGGYVSEDVYSPYMDCRMKSNAADGFCPVCKEAIEDMMHYYMDKKNK
jgi:hypothetical protein